MSLVFRFTFFLLIITTAVYGTDSTTALEQKVTNMGMSKKDVVIYINKMQHKLTLKADTMVLKEYKCVFGANPIDDKEFEGDYCTPEGTFHIKAKYPHNQWSKFMWIDYPNEESWKKFDANMRMHKISSRARIGGSVGIHGVPNHKDFIIDKGENWTLGCISLKTSDIDEIYNFIDVGTKVVITKQ